MTGRLFFDTNVLVYLLDPNETAKRSRAIELVRYAIDRAVCVVSPQTLNECYRVLTRKATLVPRSEARLFIREFVPFCRAPIDVATTSLAFAVEDALKASWWDCVMVASAIQAGCRAFLTEDMQPGREIRGLRIVNPFSMPVESIIHPS